MRIWPRKATSCALPSASSTRLLIYTVRTAVNGRLSDAPRLRSAAGRSPRPPVLREVQREVRPFAQKGFRPTPASSRLPLLVRRGNCEALEAGKTCAAMPARHALRCRRDGRAAQGMNLPRLIHGLGGNARRLPVWQGSAIFVCTDPAPAALSPLPPAGGAPGSSDLRATLR